MAHRRSLVGTTVGPLAGIRACRCGSALLSSGLAAVPCAARAAIPGSAGSGFAVHTKAVVRPVGGAVELCRTARAGGGTISETQVSRAASVSLRVRVRFYFFKSKSICLLILSVSFDSKRIQYSQPRSTQCTIERDSFLFSLLMYKRFLDLHRVHKEGERETVTTTA